MNAQAMRSDMGRDTLGDWGTAPSGTSHRPETWRAGRSPAAINWRTRASVTSSCLATSFTPTSTHTTILHTQYLCSRSCPAIYREPAPAAEIPACRTRFRHHRGVLCLPPNGPQPSHRDRLMDVLNQQLRSVRDDNARVRAELEQYSSNSA
jgi:hypothetical protein